MRNLFKNAILFAALCVALSGFTACSNTQKGSEVENSPTGEESKANTTAPETKTKDSMYPPAPSGILKTEIKDLDGNVFKVEDKKGKVVLLNLWATWCGPCRDEMPEIVEMQEKYKDKGFEVYGLNTDDESADDIKSFAQKMKLNYQLGYASTKMIGEFIRITRVSGIPQTIIVDREGRMVFAVGGGGRKVVNDMKAAVEKTVNE
jgi:thiol-disulfide isomerase/thioredoxin